MSTTTSRTLRGKKGMSAVMSDCGQYRYRLTRPAAIGAAGAPALFIMLNPSTADHWQDDPTIGRCRSFAAAWGCAGVVVVNLYALRTPYPAELWSHPDPVGPANARHLRLAAAKASAVVCAWGANAKPQRVEEVVALLVSAGAQLKCLGVTKSGAPRHPLYVRGDQPLLAWPV